ncbi:sporulation protein [bacterium]|nr:sporulation protein [bacterium]
MVIEDLIKTVLDELRKMTRTENVVGDPLKLDTATIIPVSRISVGFGAGGGAGTGDTGRGEATGGGASIEPVAFIVIRDDKVELISVKEEKMSLGKVIDLVPGLIDKVKEAGKKQKDET